MQTSARSGQLVDLAMSDSWAVEQTRTVMCGRWGRRVRGMFPAAAAVASAGWSTPAERRRRASIDGAGQAHSSGR